jgi:hypothetical protein
VVNSSSVARVVKSLAFVSGDDAQEVPARLVVALGGDRLRARRVEPGGEVDDRPTRRDGRQRAAEDGAVSVAAVPWRSEDQGEERDRDRCDREQGADRPQVPRRLRLRDAVGDRQQLRLVPQ